MEGLPVGCRIVADVRSMSRPRRNPPLAIVSHIEQELLQSLLLGGGISVRRRHSVHRHTGVVAKKVAINRSFKFEVRTRLLKRVFFVCAGDLNGTC